MAFHEIYEYKQHLNLSIFAYEVMNSDMFSFGQNKRSGFINRVFENYYQVADASIYLALNKYDEELSQSLSDIKGDEETKKIIKEKLKKYKETQLKEKVESYENSEHFKFNLNKSNFERLSGQKSVCEEDKYYKSRGKYIKCVLEEYARLPYVEREKIYFSQYIEEIQNAILKKQKLKIETTDEVYSIAPYKILSDPLSIANYLVGFGAKYASHDAEKVPCSFRISALKSVTTEKSKSAFLSEKKQEILSKAISTRGVQFMAGESSEICVKLTEAGITKYKRQAHLRPPYVEIREGNIYVFQCTQAQAEFYFFKLGKDVEILSPENLREKFKAMYENAIKNYT